MIIKHIIELETIINEDSNEPAVKSILAMPAEERQMFFQQAGASFIAEFLTEANKGNSWAVIQVANKETV
jgi:hypothetical protein